MPSKKNASEKRARFPRASDFTKEFRKDWVRLSTSGRYDMKALKRVMTLLIENDAPLPAEFLDHPLKGNWANHRECHIGGDFLLVYMITQSSKMESIMFIRAGSHSDIFE